MTIFEVDIIMRVVTFSFQNSLSIVTTRLE